MTSYTRINRLRSALSEGDIEATLRLLAQMRADKYPKVLLRPLLSSCHPGLDESFLDLDLLPPSLLIAPRLPEAIVGSPLDSRRLSLTHRCSPIEFVTQHLNEVLRGERPLYADLPALNIHTYQRLVRLSPGRCDWLKRFTAFECLALEAITGVEAEVSALSRWAPSRHDASLERPLFWIQASPQQEVYNFQSLNFASYAVAKVTNNQEALALIKNATDQFLNGGATYLLWNRADEQPPASWISMLIGIQEVRSTPFQQLGESRHGLQEIRPIRFSEERSLLAIDASWFSRRTPKQVLSFLNHWLFGPPQEWPNCSGVELLAKSEPLIRPRLCEGVLILAASQIQVKENGLETLRRRATQRALEGGFTRGTVLELEGGSGLTVPQQLKRLLSVNSNESLIVAFIGADDLVVPGSWDLLQRHFAIKNDLLLCSDEELQWSTDPTRIGQRQFASQPTIFRTISRGYLPGLVAFQVGLISGFDLQPKYLSIHGLIKDIGMQWMEGGREINILPNVLLHRNFASNPTVLNISTCNQWNPFSAAELTELDEITQRRAGPWMHPEGSLERGARAGTYELKRKYLPDDKVSVIIPFRDQAGLTRACVLSLLKQETNISFEIILVDNGSTEIAAIQLADSISSLAKTRGINVIGLRDDRAFNFSALNNKARHHCSGNFLLFLNNDIYFESPDPLKYLLNPFALQCTGAVSSRLIYEDGTIQHHGLVAAPLQSHDILSVGKGLCPGAETESFASLVLQEEWSAATAACLVIRTEDFDRIGGFDEKFTVAYNDVDLCWRLADEKLAIIVTPLPKIIHAESKSRGEDIAGEKRNRLARESGALRKRYSKFFREGDPLYHTFLNPASHRFEPAALPRKPQDKSRPGLLYSWTSPTFEPGERPFVIYVHYDPKGEVRSDVFEQLEAFGSHGDVAFVSASPELIDNEIAMNRLRKVCNIVLIRHNEGYDFGSWQAGIFYCQRYLQRVSHLILTNDSCYGPFHSFDTLFDRLLASHADVIGLTDSTAIQRHLQSYFIAYGRRVLKSPLFWSFWENISIWSSKVDLVRACEVGWSENLVRAGFHIEALYLEGLHGNVTHTHWRELLLEHGFPFIKTELLRVNPILQDISGWEVIASNANPKIAQMTAEHLRSAIS